MSITGFALIILGIICILQPGTTLMSIVWIIGLLVLISGISTLFNWAVVRNFFGRSGSIFLSGVIQVTIGLICMNHKMSVATVIPIIFAFWLLMEGINLAVRSLDYRNVGFRFWWLLMALGISASLLGAASFAYPVSVGGHAIGYLIGSGIILLGGVYLVALFGIDRFTRKISKNPWADFSSNDIDEQ